MLGYLDYLIYFWIFFYISGNYLFSLLLVLFWKGKLPARVQNTIDSWVSKDNLIIKASRGIITTGVSCAFCCFAMTAVLFVFGFAAYVGLLGFGEVTHKTSQLWASLIPKSWILAGLVLPPLFMFLCARYFIGPREKF